MTDPDPPTILIVDDQPNVATAYELWLDDYETHVATSGDEALERIDATVDVVLLDRRMPGRSGDETLREIRNRGFDCLVAMVTAVEPDFDIVDISFDTYLTKPVTRDDLRDCIDLLFEATTYSSRVQTRFSLARKEALLRSEKTEAELAGNETYTRLRERLAGVTSELDEQVSGMNAEAFEVSFRNL